MAAGQHVILIMANWGNILARKIIDLSLTVSQGKRGVKFETVKSISNGDGFNTTDITLYSHALTHMDAPKHFVDESYTMEAMNLERCVGTAIVIDVSHKAPNSLINVADLAPYADRIHAQSRLLLRTDWDSHADKDDYRTHFPRISLELAQWFVEKNIWLVGVESPSVASLAPENRAELTDVHQTLLRAEIVIVESLCNLRLLPDEVYFIALPLKLDKLDGSPVRPIAIIDDDNL